jgi:hypothetical protein
MRLEHSFLGEDDFVVKPLYQKAFRVSFLN